MLTRRTHLGSEAGNALIFSVMAVIVVSILAAGFLQLALSVTRRLSLSADTLQALNLAEAGLAEAYTGLAVAHTGSVGTAAAPAVFGGGLFWVEAEHHAGGLVELECTAMYGTGRATLGMVCEPVERAVSTLGLFAERTLQLNPDSRLDSFDSTQGTYAEQIGTPLNNQALVGSNANVVLATGDLVFGDVAYGPTGSLGLASGAVVTGKKAPRQELEELPSIEVPDVQLKKQPLLAPGAVLIVPPGQNGYENLSIARNGRLVLMGPQELVVGRLTLNDGAEMVFDTNDGPVQVYVTETLDLRAGSIVTTPTQVTSDSVFLVSAPEGETVSLGGNSSFHGFLYAPSAAVQVAASFEVFGGIVCKELQLAQGGKLHFDVALGASLESLLPKMYSWRVVDLPQQTAIRRIDPFKLLQLDPDALPTPAQAHEDQILDVRYVGSDGQTHAYTGPESAFDWNLVQELLYGVRDGVAFLLPADDPPAGAPQRDPLLDLVSSTMTSKQLRDALRDASPVSDDVLIAATTRVPPMAKSDLMNVLQDNVGMGDSALRAVATSPALDSNTVKQVLIDNSPLAPDVLAAVLARVPPLTLGDLTSVLASQ